MSSRWLSLVLAVACCVLISSPAMAASPEDAYKSFIDLALKKDWAKVWEGMAKDTQVQFETTLKQLAEGGKVTLDDKTKPEDIKKMSGRDAFIKILSSDVKMAKGFQLENVKIKPLEKTASSADLEVAAGERTRVITMVMEGGSWKYKGPKR